MVAIIGGTTYVYNMQLNSILSRVKLSSYTPKEEMYHVITHAIGLLLSIIGLVFIVIQAVENGNVIHVVSCSIYGASLVVLYLNSVIYHGTKKEKPKKIFKIFDHVSIYFLIAGSYTPFLMNVLEKDLGQKVFVVIWGLALIGAILKLFFTGRFKLLSVGLYLFMGWLVVIISKQMMASIPTNGILLILAGGLFYSFGVIFYVIKRIPYNHAIWHFFVMGGSICHYFAIFLYTIPQMAR